MQHPPQVGFAIKRQYLKDLSFENPFGPVASEDVANIKAGLEGSIRATPLDEPDCYSVETTVTTTGRLGEQIVLLSELTYVSEVELQNIPEPVRPQILSVDVPTQLIPQINSVMDHAAKAGGFPGLQLQNLDFRAFFNQAVKPAPPKRPVTS